MKPEDLVPDRATCEALEKAGFEQEDSLMVWRRRQRLIIGAPQYTYDLDLRGFTYGPSPNDIAAPTLAEITRHLPDMNIPSRITAQIAAELWLQVQRQLLLEVNGLA